SLGPACHRTGVAVTTELRERRRVRVERARDVRQIACAGRSTAEARDALFGEVRVTRTALLAVDRGKTAERFFELRRSRVLTLRLAGGVEQPLLRAREMSLVERELRGRHVEFPATPVR